MNHQPLLAAIELRCAINEGKASRRLDLAGVGKTLLAVAILVECWRYTAGRRDERLRMALPLKILAQEAKQLRDDEHCRDYVTRVEQLLDGLIEMLEGESAAPLNLPTARVLAGRAG